MTKDPMQDEAWLIETLFNDRVRWTKMPAWQAVHFALFGPENGATVRSARVKFPEGVLDRWGTSGTIRNTIGSDIH